MQMRNAIVWHVLLISAQPMYSGIRWMLDHQYLNSCSRTYLTLALLSWLYILSRITIPFFKFPFRHIPSLAGDIFPFGHALTIQDHHQPPEKIFEACQSTSNEGVVVFWGPLYLRSRVVLTTPEAVMEVINTRNYDWIKPSPAKKLLGRILGQGLIIVEGNVHKAMRKSVTPAFSGRQIRDMATLFYAKGLDFANAMAREARKSINGEVEMMGQMSRVTLDIIGSAGIGIDFDTINRDDNKLAKLYAIITSTKRGPIVLFFLINILMPPWFVRMLRGTIYSKVAIATEELRGEIRHLLAEKKQNVKQNSAGHNDIIATIMRSGDFSDDYLCDQLLTFLAAGHDTTASALTWTTWLLAIDPKIQDRLRKECQSHLSNLSSSQVTAETFENMPYLTAVCNETLRLYPTVPMTARKAAVDTKVNNVHIPKGTNVLISPWMSNRDPAIWGSDAADYNPDRWIQGPLATAGGSKSAYAFLTFLYGPRSCIGQGFARLEMKCLLAALMLRFRFEPSAEGKKVEIGGFVTIKPKGGLKLRVIDLEKCSEH